MSGDSPQQVSAEVPARRKANWLRQAIGAVPWGLGLVLLPVELLVMAFLPGLIIYAICERAWARKYGFNPGFFLRLGVIAIMVTIAAALPLNKKLNRKMDFGPGGKFTLAELQMDLRRNRGLYCYLTCDKELAARTIEIPPGSRMNLKQLAGYIDEKYGLKHRINWTCGNGTTILWGGDSFPRLHFSRTNPGQ